MLLVNNTQPTINAAILAQLVNLNSAFIVSPLSTLNEKFGIGNISPPSTGYPSTKYMVIGIGGRSSTLGVNNIPLTNKLQHSAHDAALFEHIPFKLVPVTNDLSPAERSGLRIRKLIIKDGVSYFAYYAKVIDQTNVVPVTTIVTVSDGKVVDQVPYVSNASNLNPVPVDISNTVLNTQEGRHMLVQSLMTVTLTEDDIAGIINAAEILYGDARYAVLSEIGIVSAYDVSVTSNDGNIAATYQEVRSAQIHNFLSTNISLPDSQKFVDIEYSLSSPFPMPPLSIT
jgi:hypothetical protein